MMRKFRAKLDYGDRVEETQIITDEKINPKKEFKRLGGPGVKVTKVRRVR